MRTIYFDCFSGVSGDMLLGALVDAGLDVGDLSRELEKLGLDGFRLVTSRVERSALAATKVDVVVGDKVEGPHGHVHEYRESGRGAAPHSHEHDHHDRPHGAHGHGDHGHGHDRSSGHDHGASRSLAEILDLIDRSRLSSITKGRAAGAFRRLGEAEARAHGTTPEQVHFHEVGAVDAIVDIAGAFAGVELLGVERFLSSAVNVGGGTVKFSHGVYPVPTPATAELLRGVPVYSGAVQKELVTPTGAAVLTTLVEAYGPLPPFAVERIGYGAGTRDVPGYPNVLRVLLGETVVDGAAGSDRVVVLEATVDDMTAEALGHFVERALAEGALDCYLAPVLMKKNRPATLVTLLAATSDLDRMSRLFFHETTTIGLRHREVSRRVLARRHVTVETAAGPIRVKVAELDGRVVNAAPEYEDCREAAERTGVPLRRVQALAAAAYAETEGEGRDE